MARSTSGRGPVSASPGRVRASRGRLVRGLGGTTWCAALAALGLAAPGLAAPAHAQDGGDALGQQVYEKWCAACHGVEGAGDGPGATWMLPRPRDFTAGVYQIRTTASGELPTDADLMRIVDEGMPGTTMPGWRERLTQREREAVVGYIKTFSRFFANSEAPAPLDFGSAPRVTEEGLAEGREFYERIECNRCHGEFGRGDGTSAPTLEDDDDIPTRAADLTEPWLFNGGGTVEDVYRRLRTGIDGTPMPSFSDLLDAEFLTDEQLWNVAHYVRSLAPERAPSVTEVIRVGLVAEGPLPASVDDPAWDEVERFYVPMGGQIIVSPRWFDPRVDGLWVQGLHDGEELVLRVSWSDPSESPDPSWAPWKARVAELVEPHEGEPIDPTQPHPDGLVIQFPTEIPEGMDRPYFLMGDGRNPVYVWRWDSESGGSEAVARGMTSVSAQDAENQTLGVQSEWAGGEWRLLARRSLATDDDEDLQFEAARAIPIGFSAWDGDNAEAGTRRAVSSWYFVHLEEETPATVFVAPLVATLLTAGLGLMVVTQAQKRERQVESDLAEEPTTSLSP